MDSNETTWDSRLLLGPGKRADVIIDFSKLAGQSIVLRNDAPTPFPNGDDVTLGGIRMTSIVKFDVSLPKKADRTLDRRDQRLDALLKGCRPLRSDSTFASPEDGLAEAIKSEEHTLQIGAPEDLALGEHMDELNRIQPLLGIVRPLTCPANSTESTPVGGDGSGGHGGMRMRALLHTANRDRDREEIPTRYQAQLFHYEDPVTEVANDNTAVLYDIWNLTPDSHPIHFHLASLQAIER
eukprot:tig00000404_g420.t1